MGDRLPSDNKRACKTRKIAYLTELPAVDLTTISVPCGVDDAGAVVNVRFGGVSCLPIAGVNRSGEVGRTFALIAALNNCEQVDVHIVDCKRSSMFSKFEDHCTSYVRLTDGLDLVVDAVQEIYLFMLSRMKKFNKGGISDYWDSQNHADKRFKILFVNEPQDLFARYLNNGDEMEQMQLVEIHRYLKKIVSDGARFGCCLVLSSQRPSTDAFPSDLVEHAQRRILYRIENPDQADALLHGLDGGQVKRVGQSAASISEKDFGSAYMIDQDSCCESPVTFQALEPRLVDELNDA